MSILVPRYRRNQLEWALWQLVARGDTVGVTQPPKDIGHTIKRLIDVDRQSAIELRSPYPWQHRFAFTAGEPQDRGGENVYRLEEAVSLWIGMQLLEIGLPQTEIIQFLRALKPQLKGALGRIIEPHLAVIAAARQRGGESARKLRRAELLAPAQHVYLMAETINANGVLTERTRRTASAASNICWGKDELIGFIDTYVSRNRRLILVEIANATLSLAYFLQMSPLVRRGRPARLISK